MKRCHYIYAVVGLVIAITIIATSVLTGTKARLQERNEQCRSIYTEIQDEAFFTGRWEGNTVFLHDDSFREIKQISTEYKSGKNSVRIIKDFNQIRFVLGGSVDDEYGIIFVKGTTVDMSGMYSVKRLSGNSYYYETTQG